jgi:hypothetical protein
MRRIRILRPYFFWTMREEEDGETVTVDSSWVVRLGRPGMMTSYNYKHIH